MTQRKAQESPYSVGLLCRSCDHYAIILGFRSQKQAYAFASERMGWVVRGEDGTLCPYCRPGKADTPLESFSSTGGELVAKTLRTVMQGKPVECTADEWDEVYRVLTELVEITLSDGRYVYADLAQNEIIRLTDLYGIPVASATGDAESQP